MIKLYNTDIDEIDEADYIKEYSLLRGLTKQKIDIISIADNRRRSLAGLILLRRGIKALYGREDYDIRYNENGKPLLDFCCFNISHSGKKVICAISDLPVGVDIEEIHKIDKKSHYPLFSDAECKYVNENKSDLNIRFFEIWTKKEAYTKLIGGKITDTRIIPDEIKFSTQIKDGYYITICEKS